MINATDKKYQVSAEFEPDKEPTWHFPPQNDEWAHAHHNAIRGELNVIREVLIAIETRAQPLEEWEIVALNRITMMHFEHIHAHHSNEDDLFVPELRKRVHLPEKLVSDHLGLLKKLEELEKIIKDIKSGDCLVNTNLLQQWIEYHEMMLPHLQEEEDIAVLLMRAYFTPKDITPIVQKVVAKSPKNEIGALVYYMGPEKCRNEFMKQEGITSFVWYFDFQFKYKYFVQEFIHNVDALKSGVQLIIHKPWWRFF